MKRFVACILACLLALPVAAFAAEVDRAAMSVDIINRIFTGEAATVYALFTPDMKAAITADDLATLPEQLGAAYGGAYQSAEFAQVMGTTAVVLITLEAGTLMAQVSIDDSGRVQGLGIVPVLAPAVEQPLAEQEEAVTVGAYELPGVLTVPAGDKLPAVVLVHGSGPQDRNESVNGTAIFRDLAEGLSAQGIAVLRYDKRAYLMNQGTIPVNAEEILNMTVYEDTIEDAVAAVALLKADPRIDPDRVFIIGHSQGAMQAGRIQEEAQAHGLVLLAGTMRPLWTVLVDQLEALDANGYAEDIATARAIPDMTEAESKERPLLGTPAYFFWDDAQHPLYEVYALCDAPMLILQGAEDTQVYPDRDYPLWETFAAEHPEKDIELRLYDGLGHLFTDGDVLSADVLTDIAAWILAR